MAKGKQKQFKNMPKKDSLVLVAEDYLEAKDQLDNKKTVLEKEARKLCDAFVKDGRVTITIPWGQNELRTLTYESVEKETIKVKK